MTVLLKLAVVPSLLVYSILPFRCYGYTYAICMRPLDIQYYFMNTVTRFLLSARSSTSSFMSSLVSRAEAVRAALGLLKDDTIGVVGIVGAAASALGIEIAHGVPVPAALVFSSSDSSLAPPALKR